MAKLTLKLSPSKVNARLAEMLEKIDKGTVLRVGILDAATYPDGTSVATAALYNEFGTSRIPPRPFMRNTIAEKSPTWGDALAKCYQASGGDGPKALALMGEGIKGQIVETINKFSDPPNAPSTVAKKGFNKPLVDSALLLRSVDYEVGE